MKDRGNTPVPSTRTVTPADLAKLREEFEYRLQKQGDDLRKGWRADLPAVLTWDEVSTWRPIVLQAKPASGPQPNLDNPGRGTARVFLSEILPYGWIGVAVGTAVLAAVSVNAGAWMLSTAFGITTACSFAIALVSLKARKTP